MRQQQNGQLNIRTNNELKQAFIEKAKEDGTTATELMNKFMREYLNNNVSFEQPDSKELKDLEVRLTSRFTNEIKRLEERFTGELAA